MKNTTKLLSIIVLSFILMANKCTTTGPLTVSMSITDERGHSWNADTTAIINGQAGDIYHLIAVGSGAGLTATAVRISGALFQTGEDSTSTLASGTLQPLANGQLIKIYAVAKGINQQALTTIVTVHCSEAMQFGAYNDTIRQEYDLHMNILTPKDMLIWNTGNSNDKVTITPALPGLGSNLSYNGYDSVQITQTTTFSLTATNPQGVSNTTCKVVVLPPIKPLTVVVKNTDANGFPTTPLMWGYQVTRGMVGLASEPRIGAIVPNMDGFTNAISGNNTAGWDTALNHYTDDAIAVDYNQPTVALCERCIPGRYNWVNFGPVKASAITYNGIINWNGWSGDIVGDNDYNIQIYDSLSPGGLCTVDNPGGTKIECEFDAAETVNNFGEDQNGSWWQKFRYWRDNDETQAQQMMDGKHAIAIGLLGLDANKWHAGCYSNVTPCYSELHPLYAMFVHVSSDPNNDVWAFFIRNWGTEGDCGGSNWPLFTSNSAPEPIKVTLPMPGATNISFLNSTILHVSSDLPNDYTIPTEVVLNEGAVLTFNLSAPGVKGWVEGELHLQWSGNNLGVAKASPKVKTNTLSAQVNNTKPHVGENDEDNPKWDSLSPAKKALYIKKLAALTYKPNPQKASIQKLNSNITIVKTPTISTFKSYTQAVKDTAGENRRARKAKLLDDIISGKVKN